MEDVVLADLATVVLPLRLCPRDFNVYPFVDVG